MNFSSAPSFITTAFRSVLLLILLAASASVEAQTTRQRGRIINKFTREPLSYTSVYWKKEGTGEQTDSNGYFRIRPAAAGNDTLCFSFIGYNTIKIPQIGLAAMGELLIEMEPAEIKEVFVKSKSSKGLTWWKNVVLHKPENSPRSFNSYFCEHYNKQEIDVKDIEHFGPKMLRKPFEPVIRQHVDSVSESVPFLPVFITETLSDYYTTNDPHKTREAIKAVQVSGVKNEVVLQYLVGMNQKVNAYDDYIILFGKEFISPVSKFGDHYYTYKGADTLRINGEQYYHLLFQPKRLGENTFSGDCWIYGNSWALQKVTMDLSKVANINFVNRLSVIQEYRKMNDTQWAVSKDKFVVELSPLGSDKLTFIGRKTDLYNNVHINESFIETKTALNKRKDETIENDSADQRDKQYWSDQRLEPLSVNEQKVYHMIDTLQKMPAFKRLSNTITFLIDGHKKLGMLEIGPWFKWISRNQLEGMRTRFDLGTTEDFSKTLRLHGYLAYGTKDRKLKGSADVHYKAGKGWSGLAAYTHDLDNGRVRNGEQDATTDNMFSQLLRREHLPQKFLAIDAMKIAITKRWQNNISATGIMSRTTYETFNPLPPQKEMLKRPDATCIVNTEAGIRLRYAPGEREIAGFRKTRRFHGTEPVFELSYAMGIPNILQSDYTYHKLTASIQQKFRLPRWGTIEYNLYGGKIFGDDLPFMLLEVHPGNEVRYYSKNTFSLMNRFEYFSDTYAGLMLEHNFGKKFFNLFPFMRKTNMRQFWNVKTIYGTVSERNQLFNHVELGGYHLKTLNGQFYTELGTGVDNIFRYFRVDCVWRFAPNAPAVPTHGPSLNFTNQNFGVLGSFHLQF